MDWSSFFIGVSLTAWLVTVGGVSYAVWRYVWTPWKIMRADLKNMAQNQEDFKAKVEMELGLRKGTSFTDEELAKLERRETARRIWAARE